MYIILLYRQKVENRLKTMKQIWHWCQLVYSSLHLHKKQAQNVPKPTSI